MAPEDQWWLFPPECVALQQICMEFEDMYPGQKYELTFRKEFSNEDD